MILNKLILHAQDQGETRTASWEIYWCTSAVVISYLYYLIRNILELIFYGNLGIL